MRRGAVETRVAVFALQKQRGLRAAKNIDALLDVADDKQIALINGNAAKDHILNGVDVLVLVDDHRVEPRADLTRELGLFKASVLGRHGEQLQGEQLGVREREHVLFAFELKECVEVFARQLRKLRDIGREGIELLLRLR